MEAWLLTPFISYSLKTNQLVRNSPRAAAIPEVLMSETIIDKGLVDAVRAGRAVLFLGAGASFGATATSGAKIPMADDLKRLLAKRFLEPGYEDADFKTVYDFAASNSSVRQLQQFLYDTFHPFEPAPFHHLIPKFVWAGLATTNYDLIIEKTYRSVDDPLQDLLPCCSDAHNASIPPSEGKLLYVKLHGCISQYQIVAPPLVGSTEQIIHHKEGRSGQFAQFLEWARTCTLIFAGYGLGDANLRTMFDEIVKDGDNRPRHYILRPGMKEMEQRYWSDRRVHAYPITFQALLEHLNNAVLPEQRKLALHATAQQKTTITRFIAVSGRSESPLLQDFVANHCDVVCEETATGGGSPQKFYEGFDLGWYPLERSLDIERRINATILNEQVIPTTAIARTQLAVLKAHAGAGKSVTLRRIAWNAAKKHGRLVLFAKSPSGLSVDAFEEIVSLTNQTIYLVIDDLADLVEEAERLIRHAKKKSWRLVVIAGARVNEWNTRCEQLHALVDEQYELKYLSEAEIDGLLAKLEAHGCLGFLASLTPEKRKHQLREVYGRQLLVALHEATKNKSFRDIIRDEFLSIYTPEARILYLDVCSLHRLGPPVRAGLIARVHGIRFEDFQEQFLLPLEQVIDVQRDAAIGDWVYKARHSYIAQIVYEEALKSVEDKFDNIMRIIGRLNPTYSYDREVIEELVRAAALARNFRDRKHGDAIFEAAIQAFGEEPFLLHQRGIYEMRLASTGGALDIAERYLRQAIDQAPSNSSFQHSLAELALRRADQARDPQERATWRAKADGIASALARHSVSSHAHHTLVKSAVAAVQEALDKAEKIDDELTHEAFSQAVKTAEDRLRQGLQKFPNEPYLLNEEATLSATLRNAERALKALGKAFEKNPKSELVARRYARVLTAKGEHGQAVGVLRRAIEHSPGSFALNFDIAQAIRASEPDADTSKSDLLLYYFQRSFSKGDRNYEAQFWYARQLCIVGKQAQARQIFETLRHAPVAYEQKRKVRGLLRSADRSLRTIYGVVYKVAQSYGFIRADLASIETYFDFSKETEILEAVQKDDRVSFNLGFSLFGACAENVNPV